MFWLSVEGEVYSGAASGMGGMWGAAGGGADTPGEGVQLPRHSTRAPCTPTTRAGRLCAPVHLWYGARSAPTQRALPRGGEAEQGKTRQVEVGVAAGQPTLPERTAAVG